jgi:hypothetical protein
MMKDYRPKPEGMDAHGFQGLISGIGAEIRGTARGIERRRRGSFQSA